MKNTKKQVSPYAELSAKQLRVLAEQGDAEAQFILAGRYKKGIGIKKDFAKVVEWYTKAAEQGDQEAKEKLLLLHKA